MQTVILDDELADALERVSRREGKDRNQVAADAVRRYVQAQERTHVIIDQELKDLYKILADEDVELANQGMDEYADGLREADRT
jgi:metal-responsive CopG/Arc/MetJ family transcriptional regulator